MDKLSKTLMDVLIELDLIDIKREKVISLTRKLNRVCGRGIATLVRGHDATRMLGEAESIYTELYSIMDEIAPVTSWRTSMSGVEEYSEFAILTSLLKDKHIPSPHDIGIPTWIWMASLGDVVGELRRIVLNALLRDDATQADLLLKLMQDIYLEISGLDFSKTIVTNMRKKIDVARMTVERTEGDVLSYRLKARMIGEEK